MSGLEHASGVMFEAVMGNALGNAVVSQPIGFSIATVLTVCFLAILGYRVHARLREPSDALDSFIHSESFDQIVEEAVEKRLAERQSQRRKGAVLHGRVDHFAQVGQIWGRETRREAIDEVARVMRAGVRHTDAVWPAGNESANGEDIDAAGGIIIHAHGADEEEAGVIAQRLIKRLADTKVPGLGDDMRLTASFGVAEEREGEDAKSLYARASSALFAAQEAGQEEVLTASQWEEIKMLPSPAPTGQDESETAEDRAA